MGIEKLLDIAQLQNWDEDLQKHVLKAVKFVLKFVDKHLQNSERYVNVVQKII